MANNPIDTDAFKHELQFADFNSNWYDLTLISEILHKNKKICFVSPELHGRDYKPLWSYIKPKAADKNIYLCTDFPQEARSFFKECISD